MAEKLLLEASQASVYTIDTIWDHLTEKDAGDEDFIALLKFLKTHKELLGSVRLMRNTPGTFPFNGCANAAAKRPYFEENGMVTHPGKVRELKTKLIQVNDKPVLVHLSAHHKISLQKL